MLQRAKQRLGVIAQLKRPPQGSAPPPNPSLGPGSRQAAGPKLSEATGAPEPGAEPSIVPRFVIRPSVRDGKLIRSL